MSYSKQEQKNIWKNFDYYCYKSIELGFNGIISPQFFEKLKKVKKVRMKLKIELILFTTIFLLSGYELAKLANKPISRVTDNMELPILEVFFMALIIVMFYCIYKNLCIGMEISEIRTQRFKEHHEKHNK